MIYKFQVDKDKFKTKLKERYSKFIIDDNITLSRCYEMFCCEMNICRKTVFNFMNNHYSIQLLMKVIEVLEVKDIEEIFKEIE